MTSIPLRAYTHEIEGLVEHEQRLDEAIAHCRQILKTYPKHLETYRLLGKAYLEGKRYEEAVDIFERLLVAVPDDFVAHVGMSIIADDQGKLDDAIWHMERAFEVQPSNAAIQGELQRLFGRRDGVEPPKIRLTRGALAHMYVQGQLYAQAISEIRAVLAQDAERTDLQVLLAKAYFHGGQKNEAADVCAQLLSRFTYCFDANGLMVELLAGTPSADSAKDYRQRLNELDPYTAFTKDSIFNTSAVPNNAVMVERLEYVAGSAVAAPLPAAGLGSYASAASSPWNTVGARAQPDKDLPPFLRGTAAAGATEGAAPEAGASGGMPAAEASAGDLPAWVKALAPTDDEEAFEDSSQPPPESVSWLRSEDASEGAAAPGSAEPAHEDDTPAWLRDLGAEAEPAGMEAGSVEPAPEISQEEPLRADDSEALAATPEEEMDGLAWLESLAATRPDIADETLASGEAPASEAPPSEPPSWGEKAAEIGQQAAEAWSAIAEESRDQAPASEEVPESPSVAPAPEEPVGVDMTPSEPPTEEPRADWLQSLAQPEVTTEDKPSEPTGEETDSDWLEGLAQQGGSWQESDVSESTPTAAGGALSDWPKMTPPPSVGEEPAWMGGTPSETDASAPTPSSDSVPSAEEPKANAELPDWLASYDQERSAPTSTPTSDEPPPWLQTESAKAPEAPQATAPTDWQPPESPPSPPATAPAAEAVASGLEAVAETGGITGMPDSGLIPRPAKPSVALLGSAQSEMGRGNIAAALDIYGRLIHRGKSLTEIIRDLRDALNRYPVEIPLWQALGDAYMRSNRLQEALDAYTKAEELLR